MKVFTDDNAILTMYRLFVAPSIIAIVVADLACFACHSVDIAGAAGATGAHLGSDQ